MYGKKSACGISCALNMCLTSIDSAFKKICPGQTLILRSFEEVEAGDLEEVAESHKVVLSNEGLLEL